MDVSTSHEMMPPSIIEFEMVKEAFFELGSLRHAARRTSPDGLALGIELETVFTDTEFNSWPPLTVCLRGVIRTYPGGSRLNIEISETAHNSNTANTRIVHEYLLVSSNNNIKECLQTTRVKPEVKQPAPLITEDNKMNQSNLGAVIIRNEITRVNSMNSGDVGLLFDRMLELTV